MKYMCFAGMAVLNVLMILANLIGFGNGKDGVYMMVSRIFTFNEEGICFWLKSVVYLIPVSSLMYAVRDYEHRIGLNLN